MTLLAILICLGLQRYLNINSSGRDLFLNSYTQKGQAILSRLGITNEIVRLVSLLLPIIIIIAVLEYLLTGWFLNIFDFLLNVFVLFYCLDAQNLRTRLQSYFHDYRQGDHQGAFRQGLTFFDDELPTDMMTLIRGITQKIFLHSDLYVFSVLFWYILLGPVAAAVYALVTYLSSHLVEGKGIAKKALALFDWIPARITGLSYACVGNFAHGFAYWRQHLLLGLNQASLFTVHSGLAALELDSRDLAAVGIEENQMALDLVDRAILLWIVIVALCTLATWLS